MRIILYLILLVFIASGYAQITTVADAKTYFSTQDDNNVLLVSATSTGSAVQFTFEGSVNQQVANSVLSSIILNKDTWIATITYSDSTVQEISCLGGALGITESDIVNSPYSDCPLTARLTFTTKVPGKIQIIIAGRDANSLDFSHTSKEITKSHTVPVIGLYDDFENTVTVNFLSPTGVLRATQTIYIQTAASPYTQLTVTENQLSTSNPHFFIASEVIIDEQGYIRWYVPVSQTFLFPLSGNLIASVEGLTQLFIRELSGKTVATYTIPNQGHHEIIEKYPGGNLLVWSNVANGIATLDLLVEVDRTSGAIVKQWDMNNYFQRDRKRNWMVQIDTTSTDWFHANSACYDPTDNTILLSSRTQNMVAKIGYDDGTVKWILGNHADWVAPYTDYLLTPTNFNTTLDPDQDWTYLQHHPRVMPNGDILIFDDGGARPGFTNNATGYSDSFYAHDILKYTGYPRPPGYVRVVRYSVDPDAMTVTKVMEYTDFPDYPNTIVGSVHYLTDNTLLTCYGEVGKVRISDITTSEVLFAADRDTLIYRTYPIQLYPGSYTLI